MTEALRVLVHTVIAGRGDQNPCAQAVLHSSRPCHSARPSLYGCQIAILVCQETALTQCRPPTLSLPRLFHSSIAPLVYTSPEDQSGSKRSGRERTCGDRARGAVVELLSTCSAQGSLVISSRHEACGGPTSLQNRRTCEVSQSPRPRQEIHENKHMLRSKVVTSYDLESTATQRCTDEETDGVRVTR